MTGVEQLPSIPSQLFTTSLSPLSLAVAPNTLLTTVSGSVAPVVAIVILIEGSYRSPDAMRLLYCEISEPSISINLLYNILYPLIEQRVVLLAVIEIFSIIDAAYLGK